jgi:hypothetical protein
MPLIPERQTKVDSELHRAAAYFERLAAELDPRADASTSREAWAKALQIMIAIEDLRHVIAQQPPS